MIEYQVNLNILMNLSKQFVYLQLLLKNLMTNLYLLSRFFTKKKTAFITTTTEKNRKRWPTEDIFEWVLNSLHRTIGVFVNRTSHSITKKKKGLLSVANKRVCVCVCVCFRSACFGSDQGHYLIYLHLMPS